MTFDEQTKKHMIERMQDRAAQGRAIGVYQIGDYFTPERQIEEAKRGTPAGDEFIWAEKKLQDELKALGGLR